MAGLGFSEDQVRFALRRLATKRLIETPHAHYRELEVAEHERPEQFYFRATSIGVYHTRFWMGEFSFIDRTGTPITGSFTAAHRFSEGLAAAKREGKFGYVDKAGQFVVSRVFDDAAPFSEGFAAVMVDGKWGYINKGGTVTIKPQFESAAEFSEGLAAVSTGVNRVGYVDTTGRMAIAAAYNVGRPFSHGLARVMKAAGGGRALSMSYIDKTGKEVWSSQRH